MEMGELVNTRWVSASGRGSGIELTAVVSIVMVGLSRCVSMYTGVMCEAHTYARCLRTFEGSGEAMIAEVDGSGRNRRTQPRTRRSRWPGRHPEANCETDGVAMRMYWGAKGKTKAEGRDRRAGC